MRTGRGGQALGLSEHDRCGAADDGHVSLAAGGDLHHPADEPWRMGRRQIGGPPCSRPSRQARGRVVHALSYPRGGPPRQDHPGFRRRAAPEFRAILRRRGWPADLNITILPSGQSPRRRLSSLSNSLWRRGVSGARGYRRKSKSFQTAMSSVASRRSREFLQILHGDEVDLAIVGSGGSSVSPGMTAMQMRSGSPWATQGLNRDHSAPSNTRTIAAGARVQGLTQGYPVG